VIETHFHADFLSGHLELAAATGAAIGYGSVAETEFTSRALADGERVELGEVVLEVRHTPGHTPESISVVVWEHPDDETPYGVMTGDTLFIGDVGRPDLLSSRGVSSEELASSLFDSLHGRLMTLPDPTRVFPGHGAGSSCGKNLSTETSSTIGDQRESNYAVQEMTKNAFIEVVTEGQTAPPAYFSYDANLNRELHEILDDSPPPPLPLDEVVGLQRMGVVALDTRDANEYAVGHLLGSINIGLAGRYAEYAGGVIQPGAGIVLVTDPGQETEAKIRLARIGYDNVIGHLDSPLLTFESNPADVGHCRRLDSVALAALLDSRDDIQLVDVRQPGELAAGVIDGAIEMPLTMLNERLATLNASKTTVVYCAGGYRSSIAASRMRAAGFAHVSDLLGGYGAWTAVQVGPST
jgi:hydroxyacylglutathione hydrolase